MAYDDLRVVASVLHEIGGEKPNTESMLGLLEVTAVEKSPRPAIAYVNSSGQSIGGDSQSNVVKSQMSVAKTWSEEAQRLLRRANSRHAIIKKEIIPLITDFGWRISCSSSFWIVDCGQSLLPKLDLDLRCILFEDASKDIIREPDFDLYLNGMRLFWIPETYPHTRDQRLLLVLLASLMMKIFKFIACWPESKQEYLKIKVNRDFSTTSLLELIPYNHENQNNIHPLSKQIIQTFISGKSIKSFIIHST